jgi:hypothetical protein
LKNLYRDKPEYRAHLTGASMAQNGIDKAMVERLVRSFYTRVQSNPFLRAIFADLSPPAAGVHFFERERRIADSIKLGIASQQRRIQNSRHQTARNTQLKKGRNPISGRSCASQCQLEVCHER